MFKNYNIPSIIRTIRLTGKRSALFVTIVLVFCLVQAATNIMFTIGTRGVINAITAKDLEQFWQSFWLVLFQNILWWVYSPISIYICDRWAKTTMREYPVEVCAHIIGLPMTYHNKKPTGELLSAVSNDTLCMQTMLYWDLSLVLRNVVGGLAGIILMTIIDWRFAIVVMTLGVISLYTTIYFSKKLEKIGAEFQQKLANSSTDAYELVKAAKTIRLLKLVGYKQASFDSSTQLESETKIAGGTITSKMTSILIGISALSYIAIICVGAMFVYYGLSDWGTVVALTGLKSTADMIFFNSGRHMAHMQGNVAGAKRIFEIMDTPKEEMLSSRAFSQQPQNHPLIMTDVSFAYDEKAPILDHFNLKLKRNKFTALIGESGSGKSTIMKLILGLYEPTSGSIIFNGDSHQTVDFTDIRKKTAYVPQEAMLFRGSVFENIACGNENSTLAEVEKAAKLSGADSFIKEMPNGYDTEILDDGKSLSGGQKQRIAIARALVKDADILLLDEITSALDPKTEELILQTVKEISLNKTVLLITHNLNIAAIADKYIRP